MSLSTVAEPQTQTAQAQPASPIKARIKAAPAPSSPFASPAKQLRQMFNDYATGATSPLKFGKSIFALRGNKKM